MNWPKIDSKYLKEAFKEPINFWGMAGFLVGAVFFQDVTPLLLGLGIYGAASDAPPASSAAK